MAAYAHSIMAPIWHEKSVGTILVQFSDLPNFQQLKRTQINNLLLVEAAGVEPASEIAVSQESPCSVRFRMFSPQTLRTDKMRLKLVR